MMFDPMKTIHLACLAFAVGAGGAFAQTAAEKPKPAPRPVPAKPAQATPPREARVLTIVQLRDCMAQQSRVEADLAESERERASIAGLRDELKASGGALDTALAALDRTDPAAVDAHNASVKEREARVDVYEARVNAHNAKVDGMRATRDAWIKSCDGRRYDERDLQDLQKKTK